MVQLGLKLKYCVVLVQTNFVSLVVAFFAIEWNVFTSLLAFQRYSQCFTIAVLKTKGCF